MGKDRPFTRPVFVYLHSKISVAFLRGGYKGHNTALCYYTDQGQWYWLVFFYYKTLFMSMLLWCNMSHYINKSVVLLHKIILPTPHFRWVVYITFKPALYVRPNTTVYRLLQKGHIVNTPQKRYRFNHYLWFVITIYFKINLFILFLQVHKGRLHSYSYYDKAPPPISRTAPPSPSPVKNYPRLLSSFGRPIPQTPAGQTPSFLLIRFSLHQKTSIGGGNQWAGITGLNLVRGLGLSLQSTPPPPCQTPLPTRFFHISIFRFASSLR